MRLTVAFAFLVITATHGEIGYPNSMYACGDSCSDAAQSRECMCRTYTFAFVLVSPWVVLDAATGEVYGPTVELARKVCDTAGKLCKFVAVDLPDCWNGKFSNGLNKRWYDACFNVLKFPVNMAKYDFSKYPLFKLQDYALFVREGINITEETLRHPHDLRLGIENAGDGFTNDILDAYFNNGYFIKEKNIIILEGELNVILNQMAAALECGQSGGHVIDMVIMIKDLLSEFSNFTTIADLNLPPGFTQMQVRKDEQCLLRWYDEAYENFVCSDEYLTLCPQLPVTPADDHDYCKIRDEICN